MKKTLRSRIAAVAVAALGLGLLTAVPANASCGAGSGGPACSSSGYDVTVTDVTQNRYAVAMDLSDTKSVTWTIEATSTAATGSNTGDNAVGTLTFTGPATYSSSAWASSDTDGAHFTTVAGTTGATRSVVVTAGSAVASAEVAGTVTAALTPTVAGTYSATLTLGDFTKVFTVKAVDVPGTTTPYITQVAPEEPMAGPTNTALVDFKVATSSSMIKTRVNVSGATFVKDTVGSPDNLEAIVAPYTDFVYDSSTEVTSVKLLTQTAGTVKISFYGSDSTGNVFGEDPYLTLSFAVGGVSTSATGTYAYSNVTVTTSPVKVDGVYMASATAAKRFAINVKQYDADGNLLPTGKTKAVTASLTGSAGSIEAPSGGASANYVAFAAASTNDRTINVYSDTRKGAVTFTVSVNGVAQATYALKFYGAVDKLVATVNNAYVAEGATKVGAISVDAVDSLGTPVPGVAFTTTSSAVMVAAATGGSTAAATDAVAGTVFGSTDVDVTGLTRGAVTFTFTAGAVTTTAALTISGAVAKDVKWAFDKTSYTAGEAAKITFTLTDSDGKPVGDGTYAVFAAAPAANVPVTGLAIPASIPVTSGTKTYKFFMPTNGGTVTVAGTLSSSAQLAAALQGAAVSISATVAKNATEDAIAKAQADIATLQSAIAALIASTTATLTTLTAKINKIMKKLKIK